tara:strand:+ start:366 stop:578 length:213 start_codon:yes stop_codon:yes gene_type:complete
MGIQMPHFYFKLFYFLLDSIYKLCYIVYYKEGYKTFSLKSAGIVALTKSCDRITRAFLLFYLSIIKEKKA